VRISALLLGDAGISKQLTLITREWSPWWCIVGWGLAWRCGWLLLIAGIWQAFKSIQLSQCWLPIGVLAGAAMAALLAVDYTRTAAGLLPLAVLGAVHLLRRWMVAVVLVNFALPYWHMYWSTFIPVRSVLSAPPGTWVMPFTMPPPEIIFTP
jgi:hypothetical protein